MKNTIINMLHNNICIRLKKTKNFHYSYMLMKLYRYLHVKHKQKNQIKSKLEGGRKNKISPQSSNS